MIIVKCIDKFKDKQGKIIGYRLLDQNNLTKDFKADDVKHYIKTGVLDVINLTLTSDNRLVESKKYTVDKQTCTNIDKDTEVLSNLIQNLHKQYHKINSGTKKNYANSHDIILSNIGRAKANSDKNYMVLVLNPSYTRDWLILSVRYENNTYVVYVHGINVVNNCPYHNEKSEWFTNDTYLQSGFSFDNRFDVKKVIFDLDNLDKCSTQIKELLFSSAFKPLYSFRSDILNVLNKHLGKYEWHVSKDKIVSKNEDMYIDYMLLYTKKNSIYRDAEIYELWELPFIHVNLGNNKYVRLGRLLDLNSNKTVEYFDKLIEKLKSKKYDKYIINGDVIDDYIMSEDIQCRIAENLYNRTNDKNKADELYTLLGNKEFIFSIVRVISDEKEKVFNNTHLDLGALHEDERKITTYVFEDAVYKI